MLGRGLSLKFVSAVALLLTGAAVMAQPDTGEDLTKKIKFEQKLGVKLPLTAKFKDEQGKDVTLGDYFGEKPILIMPVFYTCKSSCLLVRDGVTKSLNAQRNLIAGRDFDVVAISIHPKETPELALAKKNQWIADYRYPNSENGWHLLTGSKEEVDKVMNAIGFTYYFREYIDSAGKPQETIAHAAGVVLCTPDGRASEYLLGVNYPQRYMYDGLVRAARNEIGPKTQDVYFGCLVYDPKTGRYRPMVDRILQIAGTSFAIAVACCIVYMTRKYKSVPLTEADLAGTGAHKETE